MTFAAWITLGILGGAILLFITEWLSSDLVALGVVIGLTLFGILTPNQALAGFSSPIVITIAALFIVGGAAMETGLADTVSSAIIQFAGKSQVRLLIMITATVAVLSGFISDAGTVAVMAPAIISISRKKGINPSKLLIPLSFGSLLGGSMTLIGTPPNIVVSDLLTENGFVPFQFFDFTPIGFVLLLAGLFFLVLTNRWLLPDHPSGRELQRVKSPEELIQVYQLPEDLYRLRVRAQSPLVGKSLAESDLRRGYEITVLEILRPEDTEGINRPGEKRVHFPEGRFISLTPSNQITFHSDDILICKGEIDEISHASAVLQLGVQPAEAKDHRGFINSEVGVAEILLPPRSQLIGKTLASSRFGTLYRLTVLGINRPGTSGDIPLKDTPLQFGDTLFVQGPWDNIRALADQRRDFVVVGQPDGLKGAPTRSKMILSGLIMLGMLATLVGGWLDLSITALIAAFLMIITGCLDIKDAYKSVDWKSIILIAGMLPMATALGKVGLIEQGTDWFASLLEGWGDVPTMAALFILTSLLTQVISNTATSVLIGPVALSLSLRLGYQPQAFMMLVAIAASAAFASPVSAVNTLVMGAGNYRYRDFLKAGFPLILIVMVITILLLPLIWPLK
jgi:di/tricarboxylate transporter